MSQYERTMDSDDCEIGGIMHVPLVSRRNDTRPWELASLLPRLFSTKGNSFHVGCPGSASKNPKEIPQDTMLQDNRSYSEEPISPDTPTKELGSSSSDIETAVESLVRWALFQSYLSYLLLYIPPLMVSSPQGILSYLFSRAVLGYLVVHFLLAKTSIPPKDDPPH